MIVECYKPDVVEKYIERYKRASVKVIEGDIELGENDGEFLDGDPVGDMFYRYITASGEGEWCVREEIEDGDVEVRCVHFEGKRNSFQNGSGLLMFYPKRIDGWSVIDTTHKCRGAFEGRRSYYKRAYEQRMLVSVPDLKVADLPVEVVRHLKPEHPDAVDNRIVVVDELDCIKGAGAQSLRVVYDRRDLDESELTQIEVNML